MKWILVAAIWYFVGMLCFYHMADWNIPFWAKGYYVWDKVKDVLFTGAITYGVPKIGKRFKIIFIFCVIRLVWEVASLTLSMDINNSKIIDYLFLLFLIIWAYQLIQEWRRLK